MKINHAIIMAAGRGSRMAPLTDDVPKPMAPFGSSTLIARGIERIRDRIQYIHITVGYKKAMLAQHVIEHGVSSVFNTEGHGNAWWIFNTLIAGLDEPIYVLTCDNVVELDFEMLEKNYIEQRSPAAMLVPVMPVAGLQGDYIFQDGNIVTAIDRHRKSDIYCSGIQILNPFRINQLVSPTNDFYAVWQALILKRELNASAVYPKKWFSVDTVAQLAELNALD